MKPWERECIADCGFAHENSHVSDAQKSNPGVCKYWGWVPFIYPKGLVGFSSKAEGMSSELRAYATELRCLADKLRSMVCQTGKCKSVIEDRIGDITHEILPKVYDGTYPKGL
jgi:hypothetical protein